MFASHYQEDIPISIESIKRLHDELKEAASKDPGQLSEGRMLKAYNRELEKAKEAYPSNQDIGGLLSADENTKLDVLRDKVEELLSAAEHAQSSFQYAFVNGND